MKSIVGLLKKFKVSDKTILRLYIVFSLMMGVLGLCIGFYLVTLFAINWVSSLLIVGKTGADWDSAPEQTGTLLMMQN